MTTSTRERSDYTGRLADVIALEPSYDNPTTRRLVEGILALRAQGKATLPEAKEKEIDEKVRKFKAGLIKEAYVAMGLDMKAEAARKAEISELTKRLAALEATVGISFASDGRGRPKKNAGPAVVPADDGDAEGDE